MSNSESHSFNQSSDPRALLGALSGLHEALRQTLTQLAQANDNMHGPWLDELEDRILQTIANLHTEGFSYAQEAIATQSGIAVVGHVFASVRASLKTDLRRTD